MTRNWLRRTTSLPLAALAALALAACSSTSSSTTTAASPPTGTSGAAASSTNAQEASAHNDADVAFATGMIPHHQQAVEMAALAADRASSAAVKDLAVKIQAAQQPEITMMGSWLTSWGKEVPAPMGGMDMGGTTGMMSAADMTKLTAAKGAAFDTMFLTMMISHHQGAITMAATELSTGMNANAKTLAKGITTSQTAEIAAMNGMLGGH